jgi:hypothetical protein
MADRRKMAGHSSVLRCLDADFINAIHRARQPPARSREVALTALC